MTTSVKGEDRLEPSAADFNRARSFIADVNAGRPTIVGDQGSTFVSLDTAVEAVLRAQTALPCKGGGAELAKWVATDNPCVLGCHPKCETPYTAGPDRQRCCVSRAALSAPSTKPDRESAAGWVKVDEAKWPTGLNSTSNTMLQDEFARFEADRESADEGALREALAPFAKLAAPRHLDDPIRPSPSLIERLRLEAKCAMDGAECLVPATRAPFVALSKMLTEAADEIERLRLFCKGVEGWRMVPVSDIEKYFRLSNPCARIEQPRHNLDEVGEWLCSLLAAAPVSPSPLPQENSTDGH